MTNSHEDNSKDRGDKSRGSSSNDSSSSDRRRENRDDLSTNQRLRIEELLKMMPQNLPVAEADFFDRLEEETTQAFDDSHTVGNSATIKDATAQTEPLQTDAKIQADPQENPPHAKPRRSRMFVYYESGIGRGAGWSATLAGSGSAEPT